MCGEKNTGLGDHALNDNESGSENTAVGYYAMESNQCGDNNTATGYKALYNNTVIKEIINKNTAFKTTSIKRFELKKVG